MNRSIVRHWGLSTIIVMMAAGCASPDIPEKVVKIEPQRPVLIVKPFKYEQSVKKEVKQEVKKVSTPISAPKLIHGKASYYANMFQGRKTANGQIFDQGKLTAAHRSLAFGTKVKVTNISNHKSVIVTINDRGPFIRGRIIDLSRSAFKAIGNTRTGVLNVTMEILK